MLLPHLDRPSSRPPSGVFRMNRDSPQADGLVVWTPSLGNGGTSRLVDYISGRAATIDAGAPSYRGDVPEIIWASDITNGEQYSHDGAFGALSSFSLVAWVYFDATPAGSNDLYTTSGGGSKLILRMGGTTMQFYLYRDGGWTEVNTTFAANTLYHLALTFNETTDARNIYLNAISKASDIIAGTFTQNPPDLDIHNSGHNLDMALGDFRFYDRELSADELWQMCDPLARWDLYLPVQRIWPAVAAVVGANAPTGHILGPLYGPLGGPIAV